MQSGWIYMGRRYFLDIDLCIVNDASQLCLVSGRIVCGAEWWKSDFQWKRYNALLMMVRSDGGTAVSVCATSQSGVVRWCRECMNYAILFLNRSKALGIVGLHD
ncbi:hypothetical protein CEXT_397951 [Caerostris extrusa]|uniref:Uncharacterized protein n=1 Tax=Caerostris extrusa TaxID=172846 RepID=A0AAV4XRP2_CAEEX|nr:hypothetical protein CEXT_397951 [Caerostris extrusa]